MNQAQQYLLDLEYVTWHRVSDIPAEIAIEVIDLIDEGYFYRYLVDEDFTKFRKISKRSHKAKGNTLPKDSAGRTIH